jgi:hypothetical protein
MAADFLKDRTFQLYYFDQAVPDFLVQMKCGGNHHQPTFDFYGLLIDEDTLRPAKLRFKDQNFRTVATEWELKQSIILNPLGLTPIIDDEGVVVGYLGHHDPVTVCMSPILDIDGNMVTQVWHEAALAPSLPFEVATAAAGGFGARAGAKVAVRKAMAAVPALIRLKGALKGLALKTFLRKRIVPKRLPDFCEAFKYGPPESNVPNFHAMVFTSSDEVTFEISYQVTKNYGTAAQRLTAAELRKKALRIAAEQAKLRGKSTFKMKIKYANPASREAADKLVLKAGKPQMTKAYSSGGTNPNMDYVLETEKVLANAN